MRAINDFYVLAAGPKQGVYRFLISCTITDQDGNVTDLTGDNAIVFPDCMKNMTIRQRRNLVKFLAPLLIDIKLNPDAHDEID